MTLFALALVLSSTASAEPDQPTPPAIGIGLGIAAPQGTFAINTASARFKLSDGLVLEPGVDIDMLSDSSRFEGGGTTTTSVTRTRTLSAGASARVLVASKGPVNLLGLGGVGIGNTHTVVDPEGDDNNTISDSTWVSTSWGMGVEWFLHEHFALSADATNPLATFSQSSSRDELDTGTTTGTGLDLALTWQPGVRLMGHVWF